MNFFLNAISDGFDIFFLTLDILQFYYTLAQIGLFYVIYFGYFQYVV